MKKSRFLPWIARTLRDGGWAPVLVLGAHVLASRVLPGYESYPDLDLPMHFLGGVAIAFFFHVAFRHASRYHVLAPYHRLTCAAAVFWEFAEFLSDRYLGSHAQDGIPDTMVDMALGIGGGLVFQAVSQVFHRPPSINATTPPSGARDGE
jgi:hypothetical protein